MREKIIEFATSIGVDDVGIAAVEDYRSPRSPSLESIFPGAKSLVVLAYKELPNCDSENMQIAMAGRVDLIAFSRSCNYKIARFLEKELGAKAMTVPVRSPIHMSSETLGTVADVSLRHAAVAAGLGRFGRHNLVIHPEMGTRVLFTATITDLDLSSDPPVSEDLCNDCKECVERCPAGALDEEGMTDVLACLGESQPYGIRSSIRFWIELLDAEPDRQKQMLIDEHYWRLYQAQSHEFQYFCFNCINCCPIGQEQLHGTREEAQDVKTS